MKTTLDISDNILRRAKKLAQKRQRTLKSMVEEGLIDVLEKLEPRQNYQVKPVTFKGKGLAAEFSGKSWESIRDTIYPTGADE